MGDSTIDLTATFVYFQRVLAIKGRSKIGGGPLGEHLTEWCRNHGFPHVKFTKELVYKIRNCGRLDAETASDMSSALLAFACEHRLQVKSCTDGTSEEPGGHEAHANNKESGFISDTEFRADALDSYSDLLEGIWRTYYLRREGEGSPEERPIIQANAVFIKPASPRHCIISLVADPSLWRGRCFLNENHLYFIWNEMTHSAGSAFMIANRPSKTEPIVAGTILHLAMSDAYVKPVVATFCCARKMDRTVVDGAVERFGDDLRIAIDRMSAGEIPTKEEAALIRTAFRSTYATPEEISTVEKEIGKFLRSHVLISNQKPHKFHNLLELHPFRVGWS